MTHPTQPGPLCRHCKHCRPNRSFWWWCLCFPMAPFVIWIGLKQRWYFAKCALDPYDFDGCGIELKFCSTARYKYGKCGPEGRLFAAK